MPQPKETRRTTTKVPCVLCLFSFVALSLYVFFFCFFFSFFLLFISFFVCVFSFCLPEEIFSMNKVQWKLFISNTFTVVLLILFLA